MGESYPLHKVTLWLRASDWPWLQARYPNKATTMIRDLVIEHRRQIEDYESQGMRGIAATALDLDKL